LTNVNGAIIVLAAVVPAKAADRYWWVTNKYKVSQYDDKGNIHLV
jgi:hypothetical protein